MKKINNLIKNVGSFLKWSGTLSTIEETVDTLFAPLPPNTITAEWS